MEAKNASSSGFIGRNNTTPMTNSYSNAKVTGTTNIGGFIGEFYGNSSYNKVENSFFDYETSTQENAVGAYISSSESQTATLYGKSFAEMQTTSTFTDLGWSSDYWFFEEGENPSLKPIDHGPFPDKAPEPTYYGALKAINGPIRVQTGKDNTTNSYVTVNTIFDFDNNFSFSTASKTFASKSLDNLEIVQNQLNEKIYEIGLSRMQLNSQASSTATKVKKANNVINAWTGVDAEELEARKARLLSDITNTKSLLDQTLALNAQICKTLIFETIYGNKNSSTFNLYSPTWLTDLLS